LLLGFRMQTRRSLAFLLGAASLAAPAGLARASADQCTPARLMIVLDKSSSMQTGTISGVTKWNIARDALDQVSLGFEGSLQLGLDLFPQPDECGPGTVRVAPALGNRTAIMSELASPPPSAGNWTPMAQTLEALASEPSMTAAGPPRYAVLVTDGWQWCSPYDASTRFDGVDAVANLNAAGITTFVVGFGGAVDALALNQMAVTAGTARLGCDPSGDVPGLSTACYYSANDPAELLAALTEIAVTASSEICDGEDNDCDGEVDEGLTQECASACGSGTEVCVNGAWTGCDAPPVVFETCNGIDDDCDGVTDPGCDCSDGDSRPCGGTETTGVCHPGTQYCLGGHWGSCEGAVGPGSEMCNGLDDDCDGRTDEMDDDVGSLCGPGFSCVDGGCEEVDPQLPPDDEGNDNPAVDDGSSAGGCGCASQGGSGTGGGALLALMVGLALVRRRR